MMRKRLLAFLLTLALTLSVVTPALAADDTGSSALVTYSDLAAYGLETQDGETETLGTVLRTLFTFAGLKDSQLGSDSDCVALADSLGMLDKNSASADEPCTKAQMAAFLKNAGYQALVDNQAAKKKEPLFVNGMAQPVFPYTTGSVTSGYSNETSDIIRYCVYVETNYDTDGDGKLDLVKALVQVPKAAAEGDYKAATIYEARPYITGCTDRSMGYDTEADFNINDLYATPAKRTPAGTATTSEAAANAKSSDWYYYNPFEDMMDYEDLEWYDYYLVRGYAVVECGGLGTRGSEGYETCGSDLEIDAFKCVIEWLHGDRVAYTDKTSNIAVTADWSNGKVGMTGRSYAGTTQFGLATTGVAGLETIVPVAGIASWYEYTNSQGISTRSSTAYTNTLAAYCAGRYLDSDAAQAAAKKANVTDYVHSNDYASISERYSDYLGALANQQTALNGDYASQDAVNNDTWSIRDYTVDTTREGPIGTTGPSQIQCSALIVHGLNDYNVRTKEFELMYNAFTKNDNNVKILLHQDGHLTPTYPAGGYVFDIGDSSYDEILNRWFSHYLYNVKNGAEDMAAVTAQDSHNTSKWNTYDSWETAKSLDFTVSETGTTTTINSDYNANSVTRNNWQDKFTAGTTTNSVMYTQAVTEDTTVKGSVAVKFSALTENLGEGGTPIQDRDGLMVSAMLVDIAPSGTTFPAFNTSGSYVPKATALQDGAWMGGGLKNFNKTLLLPSDVSYKVISRGWMDLCNPEAGFDSHTASTCVALDGETYQNYTLYLQPTVYEVEAGHTLALVIYAHEPGMTSYYSYDKDWNLVVNPNFQNYQITVDNASVSASIPVATDAGASETCPDSTFTVSASAQGSGSVKSSASSATVMEGASVTFTAQPESGYRLDHWVVNGENAGSAATLTLTVNANTTVTAVFTQIPSSGGSTGGSTTEPADETPFTDVSADSPYADAILWAAKNGVTQGKTATTFGPSDPCTRGQIVTFLWRAAGSPAAKGTATVPADVAPGSYCYDAVAWALENGITKGTTATTFSPEDPCTRGQAVTFLFRAQDGSASGAATAFTDVAAGSYCADAVAWAVESGVTKGTTATTFSPEDPCTRGQIVTFLFRVQG